GGDAADEKDRRVELLPGRHVVECASPVSRSSRNRMDM
ncbi:MAG: hypothetical protein AVDCRST_MAG19-3205, partial [uncultured Thermomicrobiales bacterium]